MGGQSLSLLQSSWATPVSLAPAESALFGGVDARGGVALLQAATAMKARAA